jgi:hypothetical protein
MLTSVTNPASSSPEMGCCSSFITLHSSLAFCARSAPSRSAQDAGRRNWGTVQLTRWYRGGSLHYTSPPRAAIGPPLLCVSLAETRVVDRPQRAQVVPLSNGLIRNWPASNVLRPGERQFRQAGPVTALAMSTPATRHLASCNDNMLWCWCQVEGRESEGIFTTEAQRAQRFGARGSASHRRLSCWQVCVLTARAPEMQAQPSAHPGQPRRAVPLHVTNTELVPPARVRKGRDEWGSSAGGEKTAFGGATEICILRIRNNTSCFR